MDEIFAYQLVVAQLNKCFNQWAYANILIYCPPDIKSDY